MSRLTTFNWDSLATTILSSLHSWSYSLLISPVYLLMSPWYPSDFSMPIYLSWTSLYCSMDCSSWTLSLNFSASPKSSIFCRLASFFNFLYFLRSFLVLLRIEGLRVSFLYDASTCRVDYEEVIPAYCETFAKLWWLLLTLTRSVGVVCF